MVTGRLGGNLDTVQQHSSKPKCKLCQRTTVVVCICLPSATRPAHVDLVACCSGVVTSVAMETGAMVVVAVAAAMSAAATTGACLTTMHLRFAPFVVAQAATYSRVCDTYVVNQQC